MGKHFSGHLLLIALLAGNDVMTFINTDQHQNAFLVGTLLSVACMAGMVGLVQGSQVALTAKMPSMYMGIYMQGQAVSGVVVTLLNIVAIAVGSDSVHSASWSFLIAAIFTASSLVYYIVSTRFPLYQVRMVIFP